MLHLHTPSVFSDPFNVIVLSFIQDVPYLLL